MTDNGFCKGVEILLGRMHSHPEEFHMGITGDNYTSPWRDLCNALVVRKTGKRDWTNSIDQSTYGAPLPTLTDEEIDALYERYVEIQKEAFDKEIVQRIFSVNDQRQADIPKQLVSTGRYINSGLAPSFSNSLLNEIEEIVASSYAKDKIS